MVGRGEGCGWRKGQGRYGSQYNFPPRLIACGNLTTLASRGIVYDRDDQTSPRFWKLSIFQAICSRITGEWWTGKDFVEKGGGPIEIRSQNLTRGTGKYHESLQCSAWGSTRTHSEFRPITLPLRHVARCYQTIILRNISNTETFIRKPTLGRCLKRDSRFESHRA